MPSLLREIRIFQSQETNPPSLVKYFVPVVKDVTPAFHVVASRTVEDGTGISGIWYSIWFSGSAGASS